MRKKRLLCVIFCVVILVQLSGCSNKPKSDPKKNEAIRAYLETIGEDAKEYFRELSETGCGVVPERVYFDLPKNTPDDVLEAEPVSWKKIIKKGVPRLIVGLCKKPEIRKSEDCFTEEEIRGVLTEAVNRGLVLNIYFDSDRETYEIGKDGTVTVEVIEGADGGAYRSRREYALTEPEAEAQTAAEQTFAITYELDDLQECFTELPSNARCGDVVEIKTGVLYDMDIHVYIDGAEIEKSHYDSDFWGYSFTMPEHDVTVAAKPYTKAEMNG